MSAQDIAAIIAKLTKVQRRAVVQGTCFTVTGNRVFDFRPALFGSVSYSNGFAYLSRPTELGLAVRGALEAEAGK